MKLVPSQLTKDWETVDWILTDVDDTLTWEGKLPPKTLIAQLWPVDAVIGENGAFIPEKQEGYLTTRADLHLDTLKQQQEKLKLQVLDILKDNPDLNLTLDQSYRLCEVSIDIGHTLPRVLSILIFGMANTRKK
jgi:hypothetical protein